jgi:multisubunit Na+/H+ antiporter MnhB subunit
MLRPLLAAVTRSYVTGLAAALAFVVLGFALNRYAQADDSPGGELAGMVLVAVGVALGVLTVMRRTNSIR